MRNSFVRRQVRSSVILRGVPSAPAGVAQGVNTTLVYAWAHSIHVGQLAVRTADRAPLCLSRTMYFRALPPSLHSATMKLRILIVDDSETTRRILRAIVHSREWTVCGEAESGQAGIAKFGELKPDLVLIDLAMPDMNGLEAARNMAALDSNTPLVLFTVLDMPALVEPARAAGIAEVVSKAQAWNLVSTIERVVANRLTQDSSH